MLAGCQKEDRPLADYTKFVDPFVGTGGHGHTFPGTVKPYGMVQLSPDTRTESWDGCSGYHYSDSSILGFSHTHYSGTGEGGGGDIMFMPTSGKVLLTEGDAGDTKTGYRSAFSHKNEIARPGYYRVLLDDYNILAELTATMRVGFHKYTFRNKVQQANVILDLLHGISDDVDSLELEINDAQISGYRSSKGSLAGHHTTYFAAEFSKAVKTYEIQKDGKKTDRNRVKGQDIKAAFTFDMGADSVLMLKVAISMVSVDGARKNLREELPDWVFDKVRRTVNERWKRELNKIAVEGGTEKERRIFYTALYHAFIHPNIYMDVDRRYRSSNGKVYTAKDFDDYTNFSLWDTFRGLHPLQTIINRKKTAEFIKNFIERYERRGRMLVMEFSGNESMKLPPMIGYHSLSVAADAYAKGIRDYNVAKIYKSRSAKPFGIKPTTENLKLDSLIWQPIDNYLKTTKTVYISPTGLLNKIAFDALPYKDSILISDKYNIVYTSSTANIAQKTEFNFSDINDIALFGGIRYSAKEDNLKKATQKYRGNTNTTYYTNNKSRGITWEPLNGTKKEIDNIDMLFKKKAKSITTKTFSGVEASEEAFKSLENNAPSILHISTHGFYFPEPKTIKKDNSLDNNIQYKYSDNPLVRSGLLLAGGNHAWSGEKPYTDMEDGVLSAYETSQLNFFKTRLVVLSACQTGLGDVKGSEGVYGLQRSFQLAGASSVMISLWQVSDEVTRKLMSLIYTYRLRTGDKQKALILAQRDVKKQYPAPFYWGAFILMNK